MSIEDRYQAYAQAFEESYDDNDWSRIAQYFTEDAVYEGDPDAQKAMGEWMTAHGAKLQG